MENGAALKLPDAPQSTTWYALAKAILALELVKSGLKDAPELRKFADLTIRELADAVRAEEKK